MDQAFLLGTKDDAMVDDSWIPGDDAQDLTMTGTKTVTP